METVDITLKVKERKMEGKATNEKKVSRIKALFLYLGGILSAVFTAIAVSVCKRKNVPDIRDGFNDTREKLTNVQNGIRTAKENNTELRESLERNDSRIRECEEIINGIRKKRE